MQGQSRAFQGLPGEILRRIASFLPSDSAFNLLRTNSRIHEICDDWIVWRDLIRQSSQFSDQIPHSTDPATWKRYVRADFASKHSVPLFDRNPLRWMPQLMAAHHPVLDSADAGALYQLCDPAFYLPPDPITGLKPTAHPPVELFGHMPLNPRTRPDRFAWTEALAAGFCFSARVLSYETGPDEKAASTQHTWAPQEPMLENVWFFDISRDEEGFNRTSMTELALQLHALANKAVGLFALELRSALVEGRLCGRMGSSTAGLSCPPLAKNIPFMSFMELTDPFSPGSVEVFQGCHLAAMTDPAFLEDGDWTGYISSTGQWGRDTTFRPGPHFDHFDPVGGHNLMVEWNGPVLLGHLFEKTIRFQRDSSAASTTADTILLWSNNFYTELRDLRFRMEVDKPTGLVWIEARNSFGVPQGIWQAVITPFGIVSCITTHSWMWLWKGDWCQSL